MNTNKEKRVQESVTVDSPLKRWMKHLGAAIILVIVAMLYFKPIAFEGMSLQQHDNVQAVYQHQEIRDYQQKEGNTIRWTNQAFGGMPTAVICSKNSNYVSYYFSKVISTITLKGEIRTLFLIMLCAYIGLALLGCNFVLSIGLSIILGFFTSNTLYIAAGHTGKIDVLAITPMIVGAFIYAYRKNLLVGTVFFALGMSYSIMRNHVQMTYYTGFALAILGGFFLFEALKKQELPKFGKFALSMFLALVLGICSNMGSLWSTYDYAQASTRGKSELVKEKNSATSGTKGNANSGLGYDYVFGLSMEKSEIGTLMFPNFYGGTQGKSFYSNPESATRTAFNTPGIQQEIVAAAKRNGINDSKQINQFMNQLISQYTRQYRGSQTMCGGPMYYGVVVCFLLVLALLLLQGTIKWALITTFGLYIMLAWGKHFAIFNDLMYYYFPLYAKFRDTKMTLLVAQPIAILTIGLGLMELVKFQAEKYTNTWSAQLLPKIKQTVSKEGYVVLAGAISLGICILTYVYLSMGAISGPQDAGLMTISPKLVAALQEDRAALAKADILKAMGFIVAATVVLYLYAKNTLKIEIAAVVLTLLAIIDLNMVNADYLNENSYTRSDFEKKVKEQPLQKADALILKDKSFYKVVDYSRGAPSQTAVTSAFHKSMGGYSAAKPLLYQEFWNYYQMDNPNVALKQHSNLMNMLNVKYILVNPDRPMDNPTALGNAWFVEKIETVANANKELEALDALEPIRTAVVQEKYANYVNGLESGYHAGDKIYLKHYHPDTMIYHAEATKDRFAVFSEMYYPKGWNVYIDGNLVEPFIKTNYVLRGLNVPAGTHEIKMIYEPASVFVGATIGLVSSIFLLLLIGAGIYYNYKAPKDDAIA